MGEMGKGVCPTLIKPFLESNDGSRKLIPILSTGVGSYLSVPCMGAPLNRFEWEGEKNKFESTSNMPVLILNVIIRILSLFSFLQWQRMRRREGWNTSGRQCLPLLCSNSAPANV